MRKLADRLGVDRTYVSKVLSGSRQIRDVGRLRQVARTIGVPPERFGLLPEPGELSAGKVTAWLPMFEQTLMPGAGCV